jgi:predicted dehydrogenase
MRPGLHQFRIYGTKNGLLLDHDQETLIRLPGKRLPSYAEKFIPPVGIARQELGNVLTNLRTLLRSDFHMKSGMKYLIESFYRSIVENTPDPIRHEEILLTARIMDKIFSQLDAQRRRAETYLPSSVC